MSEGSLFRRSRQRLELRFLLPSQGLPWELLLLRRAWCMLHLPRLLCVTQKCRLASSIQVPVDETTTHTRCPLLISRRNAKFILAVTPAKISRGSSTFTDKKATVCSTREREDSPCLQHKKQQKPVKRTSNNVEDPLTISPHRPSFVRQLHDHFVHTLHTTSNDPFGHSSLSNKPQSASFVRCILL